MMMMMMMMLMIVVVMTMRVTTTMVMMAISYICMRSVYGAQNSIPPTDAITSSPSPSSWPDVSGLMQSLFFLVTELAPAARWSVMAAISFHRI